MHAALCASLAVTATAVVGAMAAPPSVIDRVVSPDRSHEFAAFLCAVAAFPTVVLLAVADVVWTALSTTT